jgi:hypothetical protein
LAQLLMLAHGAIAAVTKTPEMELSNSEASMLADPMSDLFVLYDIAPPPEVLLAMRMIHAAAYVYGPRVVMIRSRLRDEADARRAKAAKTVTPDTSKSENTSPPQVYTGPVVVEDFMGAFTAPNTPVM